MLDRTRPNMRSSDTKSTSLTSPTWTVREMLICAIGVLLIILGALIGRFWEQQIDKKFQEEMVLTDSSAGVKEWISPSVSIITKMYFWNWTNHIDLETPDFKPILNEVGPYTFREEHEKVNLTWHNNGTVSYKLMKKWFFLPEWSSGSLNDSIISINVLAAAVSAQSQGLDGSAVRTMSFMLAANYQKVHWEHTILELTFGGFNNPIQTIGSFLFTKVEDKFGFFYNRNGTIMPNLYTMSTGAYDIQSLGQVISYNNLNSTFIHKYPCSQFKGSFGELWSPHLTSKSVLTMFTPDMCRSISYYYEKESTYNGIPTLVFSSNEKTVDNGTLVNENSCYCAESGCKPSGLYDVRSCHDAPIFMSLPHFYNADPIYRDAVVGMNPDHEKHKFFLEMEPRTAVPLKVAARLQLNVLLMKHPKLTKYSRLKNVLMPVWWMETVVALPESHTSGVKTLIWLIFSGPFISGAFIGLGVILILFLIFKRYVSKARCRRKEIDSREKSDSLLYAQLVKPKPVNGENVSLKTMQR